MSLSDHEYCRSIYIKNIELSLNDFFVTQKKNYFLLLYTCRCVDSNLAVDGCVVILVGSSVGMLSPVSL